MNATWTRSALLCLVVAGGLPPAAQADEADRLGRLFLTPAQRLELDQRRPVGATDAALPADMLPARAVPRQRVVLNGMVRRGAGAPMVWVNGRQAPEGARAAGQGRVALGAADGARLKPGQAWDPATGRVSECIGCAAPVAAPAAPEPVVPAAPAAADAAPAAPDPAAPAAVAAAQGAP